MITLAAPAFSSPRSVKLQPHIVKDHIYLRGQHSWETQDFRTDKRLSIDLDLASGYSSTCLCMQLRELDGCQVRSLTASEDLAPWNLNQGRENSDCTVDKLQQNSSYVPSFQRFTVRVIHSENSMSLPSSNSVRNKFLKFSHSVINYFNF